MESSIDPNSNATSSSLPDTQSLTDHRHIPIRKVGIRDLEIPLHLDICQKFVVNTIANCALHVSLPPDIKGTHMSRFVETLENLGHSINPLDLRPVLEALNSRLPSQTLGMSLKCPLFLSKPAPVSGISGPMKYEFFADAELSGETFSQTSQLKAWVTTLCPCSKAISDFSAHNQRGEVTVTFQASSPIQLDKLIATMEKSASSELFSVLKRVDEKEVTENAYKNPVFVEDLVRNIADEFLGFQEISHFLVEAENFESIHLHNAYALVDSNDCR